MLAVPFESLRDGDDLHAPGGRVTRGERGRFVAAQLRVTEMLSRYVLRLDVVMVVEDDLDLPALVTLQSGDPRDRRREPAPGPSAADEVEAQAVEDWRHQRRRPGVGKVEDSGLFPYIIPRFCHRFDSSSMRSV